MRFDVECPTCGTWIARCPRKDQAEAIAERHDHIRKGNHQCRVETVLHTPFEGLLT